jgi:hypothetical protein
MPASSSQETPISRRKNSKPIDKEKKELAVKLAEADLPHSQIAEIIGCERSTISRLLQPYALEKRSLEEDKKQLGNIFLDLSMRYARSITDEDIKKTPPGARITNMAIAYDKYRLETNQSTENVSVITATMRELRKQLDSNDSD